MAEVALSHVKKIYDSGFEAVKDFDLTIHDKEFVVFVGPSGCGKSTTLRMIAGLENISAGTVSIGGRVVNDVEPKDRDIAMVFQNYALYPHMSVYENIAFGLRLRKMPREEIHRRVIDAARILGISDLLTRRPRALSGGQRQRVAIGRAIVREPQVFLMDEPLSNLDAKLRNQMRAEILLLRKRMDTTFIYVTHDQTEAMTLGDRIVIMKDGLVRQVGTPQEVFDHPADRFVAGFIGMPQMNFVDTTLTADAKHAYVRLGGKSIPLPREVVRGAAVEGERTVCLGIRPEHLLPHAKARPETVAVQVVVAEMLGSEAHLHTETSDGVPLTVRVQMLDLPDEVRWLCRERQTLHLSLRGDRVHLFDPHSENRLE